MKYASSGTVALAIHHDLPFIPLHCHFITFTSTPKFTLLQLASFELISLHVT
jgi:hypothetical protein